MTEDRVSTTLFLPREQTYVIEAIVSERRRQVEVEGWTPAHDDSHEDGSLADAASCYAAVEPPTLQDGPYDNPTPLAWPAGWSPKLWKPTDRRRDLIKAAALIVAEIERLDRADAAQPQQGEEG